MEPGLGPDQKADPWMDGIEWSLVAKAELFQIAPNLVLQIQIPFLFHFWSIFGGNQDF